MSSPKSKHLDVVTNCWHVGEGACTRCITSALAAARREGAQEMRERCAELMADCDMRIWGLAKAIRALPLEKEKS